MAYVQAIYTVYIVHISRASRFDLPTRARQHETSGFYSTSFLVVSYLFK